MSKKLSNKVEQNKAKATEISVFLLHIIIAKNKQLIERYTVMCIISVGEGGENFLCS